MFDFLFYTELGLNHVLDLNAYDHMLFLAALAIPFGFIDWKRLFVLVSIFTIAHCGSLALSVNEIVMVNKEFVEFLIPITILITALSNIYYAQKSKRKGQYYLLELSTLIFGLIHGLGFSNYFNMIIAGEDELVCPLIAFAIGIEIAQLCIILIALFVSYLMNSIFNINKDIKTIGISIVIALMTLPILYNNWPF